MSPQLAPSPEDERLRLVERLNRLDALCREGQDRYAEHLAAYRAIRAFDRRHGGKNDG